MLQGQMLTVNVTSSVLYQPAYIYEYNFFAFLFVEGGVGVNKPLFPASKLCLLCSLSPCYGVKSNPGLGPRRLRIYGT
jgi:hypothetical protein